VDNFALNNCLPPVCRNRRCLRAADTPEWRSARSESSVLAQHWTVTCGSEPIGPQDRVPFAARFVDLVRQRSIMLRGFQQPIALLRQQIFDRAFFTIDGVLSKS
jgi:hypothetical protein